MLVPICYLNRPCDCPLNWYSLSKSTFVSQHLSINICQSIVTVVSSSILASTGTDFRKANIPQKIICKATICFSKLLITMITCVSRAGIEIVVNAYGISIAFWVIIVILLTVCIIASIAVQIFFKVVQTVHILISVLVIFIGFKHLHRVIC